MEALGLSEVTLWDAELRDLAPTFDLHKRITRLLTNAIQYKSPRLVAGLMGLVISLFSPVLTLPIDGFNSVAIAQSTSCNVLLRRGAQGESVRQMQTALRAKGYKLSADGVFGSQTESVLKSFQASSNLSADGIYGNNSCRALTAVRAQTLNPTTKPNSQNISSLPSSTRFATTRIGDRNQKVTRLQQALQMLGYTYVDVDGSFGNTTLIAVRDFQRQNNLTQDGIVGPNTSASIEKSLLEEPITAADPKLPTPLIIPQPQNNEDPNKFVVAVPSRSGNTLALVQQLVPNAYREESRLGTFVRAGSYSSREGAESLSYALRSYGLDARVIRR